MGARLRTAFRLGVTRRVHRRLVILLGASLMFGAGVAPANVRPNPVLAMTGLLVVTMTFSEVSDRMPPGVAAACPRNVGQKHAGAAS